MHLTRRTFLQLSCLGVASTLTGCNEPSAGLFDSRSLKYLPGYRPPLLDPSLIQFSLPQSAEIDLTSHLLNRLTFGFRARDYTKLQTGPSLAAREDYSDAENAWLEAQLAPASLDDSALAAVLRKFDILHEPMAELYEYKDQFCCVN